MLTTKNIQKITYGIVGTILVLYMLTSLLGPVDPATTAKYKITDMQLRLMTLPMLLVIAGIWVTIAYGFAHFKRYALLIKDSVDGKGINTIADGLGVVALQIVLSGALTTLSTIESVKSALGGKAGLRYITTYIAVVFSVVAYYLIWKGAKQLMDTLPERERASSSFSTLAIVLVISVVYLGLLAVNYPPSSSPDSVYSQMSLAQAVATVGLPYIISWFFAVSAASLLSYYKNHVKGTIYKAALRFFVIGLYIIVICSIFSQLLGIASGRLESWSLAPLLGLVYVFVAAIGVGYFYVASSAKKLRKIEEL